MISGSFQSSYQPNKEPSSLSFGELPKYAFHSLTKQIFSAKEEVQLSLHGVLHSLILSSRIQMMRIMLPPSLFFMSQGPPGQVGLPGEMGPLGLKVRVQLRYIPIPRGY